MRRILEVLGCLLLVIAAAVATGYCVQQWPTATSQARFNGLPDFHYLAAADELRGQQRYAEAAMVARAGLAEASEDEQTQLQAELTQIAIERTRGDRARPASADFGSDPQAADTAKTSAGGPVNEFSPFGHIKEAETLRRAEVLAQKAGGVFALWIGQDAAAQWLKNPSSSTDDWLIRAATKGRAGVDLLVQEGPIMLRQHPLLARLESIYGSQVPAELRKILDTDNDVLTGFSGGALLYLLIAMAAAFIAARRAGDEKKKPIFVRASA